MPFSVTQQIPIYIRICKHFIIGIQSFEHLRGSTSPICDGKLAHLLEDVHKGPTLSMHQTEASLRRMVRKRKSFEYES